MTLPSLDDLRVAIIGLGYVGLPLAVEFGRHFDTVGVDIDAQRIAQLRDGHDVTREVAPQELAAVERLSYTDNLDDAAHCDVYIITVPTPIDDHNQPDLSPLKGASESVGPLLNRGNIVIYESTVFPGATEEICVPLLEEFSGLRFNQDFFVGYSPERINPGDKVHRLTTITKVTAGSTDESARLIDNLYDQIIDAGTHLASSIQVAEAAKVIENTQRDVNIALINELALIFNRLGIDTKEVLEAAGTKWNFLNFRPGLVGGHCIGVDPYYLTHKAEAIGYHPEMILAGRRINDHMGEYVAREITKLMTQRRFHVVDSDILVMGLAFKANCPDLRNTKVIDLIRELQTYHANVHIYDPLVDPDRARHEYGVDLIDEPTPEHYNAIVLAVAHDEFKQMGPAEIRALGSDNAVLYDIKSMLPREAVDGRL